MKNLFEQIIQEGGFRHINRIDLYHDKITILPEEAFEADAGWFMNAVEESSHKEGFTIADPEDNDPNYVIDRLAGKEEGNKLSLVIGYLNGRISEVSTTQSYTVFWVDVSDKNLLRPETTEDDR
jgi:hypothetical protein